MYYCGPKYFPQWLRKILSKKFNAACEFHDKGYSLGADRWKSDKCLLAEMIVVSDSTIDVLRAVLYYLVVRTFGRFHWSNK